MKKNFSSGLSSIKDAVLAEINELVSNSNTIIIEDLVVMTEHGNLVVERLFIDDGYIELGLADMDERIDISCLSADDLIGLYNYLFDMRIYEPVRTEHVSFVVKELNASVIRTTFPAKSGVYMGLLYSSPNEVDVIIFRGACPPVNAEFKHEIRIRL